MSPVTVRSFVDLPASTERVFSVLDTPEVHVTLIPGLSRATLVERLPNGGSRLRYNWSALGLSRSKELYTTDYVPNRRMVWVMAGDRPGTIRWYFEAREDETRFTIAATCAIPGPSVMQATITPFVRRYSQRSVNTFLENLRRQFQQ